jgi:hypothetical protein
MSSLFAVLLVLPHGTFTRSKSFVEYLLLKFPISLIHVFTSTIDEDLSGLNTYFFSNIYYVGVCMSTKAISTRFLDFYKDQRVAYEEYKNLPEHTH